MKDPAIPAGVDASVLERERRLLLALGMATFAVGLDARIVAPILPSIAADLRVSIGAASWAVTSYLLPYGLCQLAYGPLADRFGKVRVASYAMLAFSIGTALCGAFAGFYMLLVLRALTGAAAAALIPLTIAYIGDTVPYSERQGVLGLLMASSGAAQGFGAAFGGAIARALSWRGIFPALGGVSIVVTLWLFIAARGVPRRAVVAAGAGYRAALVSPLLPLLGVVLVEGALFMGSFPFTSGLMESRFHSGPLVIGLTLSAAGVGQVVTAKVLPLLAKRFRESQLIFFGAGSMAVAYGLCSLALSPLWVAGAATLLGAGFSCCHSTLQTRATEAFPEGRAHAISLFAFSLFVGGALGAVLMAALCEGTGYTVAFAIVAGAFAAFAQFTPRFLLATSRSRSASAASSS